MPCNGFRSKGGEPPRLGTKEANALERETIRARSGARLTVDLSRAGRVWDETTQTARPITTEERRKWTS